MDILHGHWTKDFGMGKSTGSQSVDKGSIKCECVDPIGRKRTWINSSNFSPREMDSTNSGRVYGPRAQMADGAVGNINSRDLLKTAPYGSGMPSVDFVSDKLDCLGPFPGVRRSFRGRWFSIEMLDVRIFYQNERRIQKCEQVNWENGALPNVNFVDSLSRNWPRGA